MLSVQERFSEKTMASYVRIGCVRFPRYYCKMYGGFSITRHAISFARCLLMALY